MSMFLVTTKFLLFLVTYAASIIVYPMVIKSTKLVQLRVQAVVMLWSSADHMISVSFRMGRMGERH